MAIVLLVIVCLSLVMTLIAPCNLQYISYFVIFTEKQLWQRLYHKRKISKNKFCFNKYMYALACLISINTTLFVAHAILPKCETIES